MKYTDSTRWGWVVTSILIDVNDWFKGWFRKPAEPAFVFHLVDNGQKYTKWKVAKDGRILHSEGQARPWEQLTVLNPEAMDVDDWPMVTDGKSILGPLIHQISKIERL